MFLLCVKWQLPLKKCLVFLIGTHRIPFGRGKRWQPSQAMNKATANGLNLVYPFPKEEPVREMPHPFVQNNVRSSTIH